MTSTLPTQNFNPRLIAEIPRSKYRQGPALKNGSDSARRSFISLLRKGPKNQNRQQPLPSVLTLNCAIWLNLSRPLEGKTALLLKVEELGREYFLPVEESYCQGSETLMFSGTVQIKPESDIESVKIVLQGLPDGYHVRLDEMHIDSETKAKSNLRLAV